MYDIAAERPSKSEETREKKGRSVRERASRVEREKKKERERMKTIWDMKRGKNRKREGSRKVKMDEMRLACMVVVCN
jgi:hypothetical protein